MEAEEQRRQMSPEGEEENEASLSLPCGRQKVLQRAHLNFASSLDFEDETGMKRSRSPLQDQISFLAGGLGGGVGEKDKRNQLGPTNTPVTVSSKSN